jgi:hypothetical protein
MSNVQMSNVFIGIEMRNENVKPNVQCPNVQCIYKKIICNHNEISGILGMRETNCCPTQVG